MKEQLFMRLGSEATERVIRRFNDRDMSAQDAIKVLGIGRTRLYGLRTQWLSVGKSPSFLGLSGGDHAKTWPKDAAKHLSTLIQVSKADGPNFELYADELSRKFGFARDRSSVRRYCEKSLGTLMRNVFPMDRKKFAVRSRRWEVQSFGELYQHDSTPRHIWGVDGECQSIILSVDDATRKITAQRVKAC